jgi:hypothetical protein
MVYFTVTTLDPNLWRRNDPGRRRHAVAGSFQGLATRSRIPTNSPQTGPTEEGHPCAC